MVSTPDELLLNPRVPPTDPPASPHPGLPRRVQIWLAGALLAIATLVAYHNTFHAPFEFDDPESIIQNPSIRRLWPLVGPNTPLSPPIGGLTVSGRPLLNLSLAINYAFGGLSVPGYHVVNLLIHVLAGLALFGVLRRTFELVGRQTAAAPPAPTPHRTAIATNALPLSLTIAALWLLHPLQTEAVTYIVQRAESLVAMFYLLTLYTFIRGAAGPSGPANVSGGRGSRLWLALSALCCLAGMASKEVMVSAPLLVLLYDRTFVAGSFAGAWRARRVCYLALAATWLLLAWLVYQTGNRNATAGIGTAVTPYTYLLTQSRALLLYLKLSFWPHPLVFDYGTTTVSHLGAVWLQGTVIVALLGATGYSLWRYPAIGFAGAWFFAILAPSSSFVPIVTQTIAEHRMYLPLAAVLTLAILGAHAILGRRSLYVVAALAVVFGGLTIRRNHVYRSGLALWNDVIAKRPTNPRAYNDLGYNLSVAGRLVEAISCYKKAVQLDPDFVDAHNNLGFSLMVLGQVPEAVANFEKALRQAPHNPNVNLNYGNALVHLGRLADAVQHYRIAVAANPTAQARDHLAYALLSLGRAAEAIPEYQAALHLEPDSATSWTGLGYAYDLVGRPADAAAACQRALQLDPNNPEANNHLGIAYAQLGRTADAIAAFTAAVRAQPSFADAHNNLGNMLLDANRIPEAIVQYRLALQAKPDYADAEHNLGEALRRAGHPDEAAAHFEAARRLSGGR